MLRVKPVPGEATRFWVEGNTIQCVVPECAAQFSRKRRSDLGIGSKCPKCGGGKLDVRFHTVDLSGFAPAGHCSCEHFEFNLQPKLCRMSPQERTQHAASLRCSHIGAARDFAMDLVVAAHEANQGTRGEQ